MKKTDLAYIAGIIDGEGSIYISKRLPRIGIGMRSPYYSIGVNVKNTDKRMIDLLIHFLGGYKSIQSRKTNNGRVAYSWAMVDRKAVLMLREIYPYLYCKQEQADIVFRFRESFSNPYCGYGTEKNRVPSDILMLRELCYRELKNLHFVFSGKGKRTLEAVSG